MREVGKGPNNITNTWGVRKAQSLTPPVTNTHTYRGKDTLEGSSATCHVRRYSTPCVVNQLLNPPNVHPPMFLLVSFADDSNATPAIAVLLFWGKL